MVLIKFDIKRYYISLEDSVAEINIYAKSRWNSIQRLFRLSGREDSNLRPSGPKPDALPGCATPRTHFQNSNLRLFLDISKLFIDYFNNINAVYFIESMSILTIYLIRKKPLELNPTAFSFVGARGFEPPTLWSQTRCATGLRYAPKSRIQNYDFFR